VQVGGLDTDLTLTVRPLLGKIAAKEGDVPAGLEPLLGDRALQRKVGSGEAGIGPG